MGFNYKPGLVSVIIPTYKRPDFIARSVESVLKQTYTNLECIVVNDNEQNSDDSKQLRKAIEPFEADSRFQLLDQENHVNGSAARNFGLVHSQGEFVAFLDDDDYWEPTKIQKQVNFLNNHTNEWGAVTCLSALFNDKKLLRGSCPFKSGNIFIDILYRRIGIGTSPTLIRRIAIDDAGKFDITLKRHQDLQFFSQIAFKYKIGLIKEHLCYIESKSTINQPKAEEMMEIKKRYYESISSLLSNLSKKQLARMHLLNCFELSFIYHKSGERKKALKNFLCIFKSPVVFYLATERVFKRVVGKLFKKLLLKIY